MTEDNLRRLLDVVEQLRNEEFPDLDEALVARILNEEWRLVEDRPRALRAVRDVIDTRE